MLELLSVDSDIFTNCVHGNSLCRTGREWHWPALDWIFNITPNYSDLSRDEMAHTIHPTRYSMCPKMCVRGDKKNKNKKLLFTDDMRCSVVLISRLWRCWRCLASGQWYCSCVGGDANPPTHTTTPPPPGWDDIRYMVMDYLQIVSRWLQMLSVTVGEGKGKRPAEESELLPRVYLRRFTPFAHTCQAESHRGGCSNSLHG